MKINYLILHGLIKQRFLTFFNLGFGSNCLANSYVLRICSQLCFYFNLKTIVRIACVKHIASVHFELGFFFFMMKYLSFHNKKKFPLKYLLM